MEIAESVLERSIRRTTLTSNFISIVIALLSALAVGFGFYYNTKSTLQQHNVDIDILKQDVTATKKKVEEIEIYKGVSASEMKNLEKKVDKIDEKLDKLIMLQQQR